MQQEGKVRATLCVVTRRRALVERIRVLGVEHRLPNVGAGQIQHAKLSPDLGDAFDPTVEIRVGFGVAC